MISNSKIFHNAVMSALLPSLYEKGFEQWKPKMKAESPILHLRRQIENRRDLVDVVFDKYGRLGCFVNVGQLEGSQTPTRSGDVLSADEVTTAHLRQRCRLRGNSFFGMFKPSLLFRIVARQRAAEDLALRILSRFHEVEDWLATKRVGQHIQTYRL